MFFKIFFRCFVFLFPVSCWLLLKKFFCLIFHFTGKLRPSQLFLFWNKDLIKSFTVSSEENGWVTCVDTWTWWISIQISQGLACYTFVEVFTFCFYITFVINITCMVQPKYNQLGSCSILKGRILKLTWPLVKAKGSPGARGASRGNLSPFTKDQVSFRIRPFKNEHNPN